MQEGKRHESKNLPECDEMTDLSKRVVMISGAAGNLGIATAQAFSDDGSSLVLLDRAENHLQEIYKESADHLLLGSVDLTDPETVDRATEAALRRYDRIDVLVHTMGGFRYGTTVENTSLEDWDFMFDLNTRSSFIICKAVLPHMIRRGRGAIVLVGARPGIKGIAKGAAYSASKSAVLRLTESISAEHKNAGIRINAILPGTIDTPQNREQNPEGNFEKWVTPEALARVILFLGSDASGPIHGALIPAYGTG